MRNLWMLILSFILFACASALAGEKENDIVAMTILGEARGEGYAGMYAVACVIKQRSINRKLTPAQVCLERWQFSCWNEKDKNRPKLQRLLQANTQQSRWAKAMAKHLMNLETNYVKQADHYCTLNTNNKWTRKSSPVKIVGNHKFFKLNP